MDLKINPICLVLKLFMMIKNLRNFNWNSLAFVTAHLIGLLTFLITFQWRYLVFALSLYFVRMFFITAAYHRYFSHRTYSTTRGFQFILAWMAMTSSQKGVLWWASHHRYHHANSDMESDLHSPKKGFWWSHVGWVISKDHEGTDLARVKDFAKFKELLWLNYFWYLPVLSYVFVLYLCGGLPVVLWGFFVSNIFLWHGTFTINSLSHLWGRRRYPTSDTSRNNWFLSIITLGEGWHNNHHQYPTAARNGFFWWEYDVTYWILKLLSFFNIVWGLKPVPRSAYTRIKNHDATMASEALAEEVLLKA